MEAPPSPRSRPVSLTRGEAVVVRCNQHKWLRGEVTRLSSQGVRVKVLELSLLVNVPFELFPTHLLRFTALDRISTLPQSQTMLNTATEDPLRAGRLLVHCVRPAHLAHRQLSLVLDRDICGVCRERIISEDEGFELWDCHHGCHLECFRNRPSLVSTMTCPLCAEESPPSHDQVLISSKSMPSNKFLLSSNVSAGRLRTIEEEDLDVCSSKREREAITSSAHEKLREVPGKVALGSTSQRDGPSSIIASGNIPSLMERMKMMAIPSINQQGGLPQSYDPRKKGEMDHMASHGTKNASSRVAWISVIKDGHDIRQNALQQNIESMAKKKEQQFYKSSK